MTPQVKRIYDKHMPKVFDSLKEQSGSKSEADNLKVRRGFLSVFQKYGIKVKVR